MENEDAARKGDYAEYQEAADYLEMDGHSFQKGHYGVKHLKKIKRGAWRVRWYWKQIERHKQIEIDKGQCKDRLDAQGKPVVDDEGRLMGDCWDVFTAEAEQPEIQQNFPRLAKANRR